MTAIRAELARLVRHDDESVVHDRWIRQRYDGFYAASYLPARSAAVVTAWHEAGHTVAALAIGARFRSASIYHATDSSGRVHGIRVPTGQAFVVDAAGQLAEHLRDWTLPGDDTELRTWLAGWKADGGDARRFRQDLRATYGTDEVAAWRHSERMLTPLRPQIRQVARALLVHPRPLPHAVVATLAANA
ncbi:MAG TPA: hypothetical protein VG268_15405 [Streptosporangiaceae bacterium]|nr:hypothetical protein [Streptosporangiaceae bacterium]